MAALPIIIFVHGSWFSPICFNRVIKRLEPTGFECMTIDLPTVGSTAHLKNLEDDTAVIREAVSAQVDAGREVVMVMHSYGGIAGCNALQGLSAAERSEAGIGRGGVVRLVLLCALVLPENTDLAKIPVSPWVIEEDQTIVAHEPEHVFYNDLEASDAAYWVSKMRPTARPRGESWRSTYAAWRIIPCLYLLCDNDQALPPANQQRFIDAALDQGARINVERCAASHSPMLSVPDIVEKLIIKAAS